MLLIQKTLSSSGLDKAWTGCLWWPDLQLVAETCSTVLLKTNTKGCLRLRHKHADPYLLCAITLFFSQTYLMCTKTWKLWQQYQQVSYQQMVKSHKCILLGVCRWQNWFFSVSLTSYLFCAGRPHISERPHPHLRPYMSGQQKKRGSF